MIRADIEDTVFALEKKLEIKNPSEIKEHPFSWFIHFFFEKLLNFGKKVCRGFFPKYIKWNFPITLKR